MQRREIVQDGEIANVDPMPVFLLARQTRRLLRFSWLVIGAGRMIGLFVGVLLASALIDIVSPLPTIGRLAAAIAVLVPSLAALVVSVILPQARRMPPVRIARLIESHLPGIKNRLVSCIDLARQAEATARAPAFFARLVREAIEQSKAFSPLMAVDRKAICRSSVAAMLTCVAITAAFVLLPDQMPRALARIILPFADLPPITGVAFDVTPGSGQFLRGEAVCIRADIRRGAPERMRLELRSDTGESFWHDLDPSPLGQWSFVLSGFDHSFRYRVHGGGTWSEQFRIEMIDRPVITELQSLIHLPEYLGITDPLVVAPDATEITGPEGSAIEVRAAVAGQAVSGTMEILRPTQVQVAATDRRERTWFDKQLPQGSHTEGTWQWDEKFHRRTTHFEPAASGLHRHRFVAPTAFEVKPDEELFTWVLISAQQAPETIMLEWHDGSNWEHRAFWGADKFSEGKLDTPSRRRMGDLPPVGQWMRLEVPAKLVGVDGKRIRGMSFALCGGKCTWHRAGALPPSEELKTTLKSVACQPLISLDPANWTGRLPLEGAGYFRISLQNLLGHTSQPSREIKFVAIPDRPPQVVLDRPGSDIVLSSVGNLPLIISAFDDFGLANVSVAVQKGDAAGFVGRPVKRYATPTKRDTFAAMLELEPLELKAGDYVRYRIEARDRFDQYAQTKDYLVRIAPHDPHAADKQLAQLEKSHDPIRQKFDRLITEQQKVTDALTAAIDRIEPAHRKSPAKAATNSAPSTALDEVHRQQLLPAVQLEQQNAALAEQVAEDLGALARQAEGIKLLPEPLADAMRQTQRDLQSNTIPDMKAVAKSVERAANAPATMGKFNSLKEASADVGHELRQMRERLIALAGIEQIAATQPEAAMSRLAAHDEKQHDLDAIRDLSELREFLDWLEDRLQQLASSQSELAAQTPHANEPQMAELEKRQSDLDARTEPALAATNALGEASLNAVEQPDDAENAADTSTLRSETARIDASQSKGIAVKRKLMDSVEAEQTESTDASGSHHRRDQLSRHQSDQLQKLRTADRKLKADQDSLGKLLEQLRPMGVDAMQQRELHDAIASQPVQRALDMAEQSRWVKSNLSRSMAQREQQPAELDRSNPSLQAGLNRRMYENRAELNKVDPQTREILLKLQPRLREELLQGMQEEGPAGYREFIEDYFKRLTQVKPR